jgi:hypothetical protein
VRISKDCRCNIVTKTSTDIVDRTSSNPVIIYFDEQTLSLPETFSFAMPECVGSMSYTLTQQITTLGDTNVVSLTVNPDKLTITLQAVYKVDTYAALDKKTVTVTIVATDTECNCPVSDSFTLYFLHVCHTAIITPENPSKTALATTLLGAADTLTIAAYTLNFASCGPIEYSLVLADKTTAWSNNKLTFATDSGTGTSTATLNPNLLSYGSETLTGTLFVKAKLKNWADIAADTSKSFTWTIAACVISSITDPTLSSTGSGSGTEGAPFLYTVHSA